MGLHSPVYAVWLGAALLVLSVSVVSGDGFAGGEGTAVSPYQIASAGQLVTLGWDPNLWDKHFVLIRDLDMVSVEPDAIRPIGHSESQAFTGVFDGRGHVISRLRMVRPDAARLGLFGQIGNYVGELSEHTAGHVENLRLTDVHIQGDHAVGGLAGRLGSGSVRHCSVTGSIAGNSMVGGLVGWSDGPIDSCFASVQVQGTEIVGGLVGGIGPEHSVVYCSSTGHVDGERWIGGLIGMCGGTIMVDGMNEFFSAAERMRLTRIVRCRSDCSVRGTEAVGGLVGYAEALGEIQDCYARGPVAGSVSVGGLVGLRKGCGLVRCFSAGRVRGSEATGGLIGKTEAVMDAGDLEDYPPCRYIVEELPAPWRAGASYWRSIYRPGVVACFWDLQASGLAQAQGVGDACEEAAGLTGDRIGRTDFFRGHGWDLATVWTISADGRYPRLRWECRP